MTASSEESHYKLFYLELETVWPSRLSFSWDNISVPIVEIRLLYISENFQKRSGLLLYRVSYLSVWT